MGEHNAQDNTSERIALLVDSASRGSTPEGKQWLQQTIQGPRLPSHWAIRFARTRLELGGELPQVGELLPRLQQLGLCRPVEGWSRSDLARVAIMLKVESELGEHFTEWVTQLFAQGDNYERVSLLRGLPFLAQPRRLLGLAVEACRKHTDEVFEAIACDNPYPARFFPEQSFNQMVIRAIFLEDAKRSIVGIDERMNAELERMIRHVVEEQKKAGQPIPPQALALVQEPTNVSG